MLILKNYKKKLYFNFNKFVLIKISALRSLSHCEHGTALKTCLLILRSVYKTGHLRTNFGSTTVSVVNCSNVAQIAVANTLVPLTLVLLQLSGVSLMAFAGHWEHMRQLRQAYSQL